MSALPLASWQEAPIWMRRPFVLCEDGIVTSHATKRRHHRMPPPHLSATGHTPCHGPLKPPISPRTNAESLDSPSSRKINLLSYKNLRILIRRSFNSGIKVRGLDQLFACDLLPLYRDFSTPCFPMMTTTPHSDPLSLQQSRPLVCG